MRVAVLGAGMQGVCTALELADRGVDVELIDRADDLMTGAATANEGKIHLGYVYGADRSLNTARRMIEGAMVFAPLLRRWIGSALDAVPLSSGFIYAVHRDSQLTSAEVQSHLGRCTELIADASARPGSDYFGKAVSWPSVLSASEREAIFDPESVMAAFRIDELAVDPIGLADALKARVRSESRIEVRLGCRVIRLLTEAGIPAVVTDGADGPATSRYDHVVNALWDSRIAMDATRGEAPTRPWLHRFKYGLRITAPAASTEIPTFVLVQGPFGDVVRYSNGAWYLSWYPACCVGSSTDLTPPDWNNDPNANLAQITNDTVAAFSGLLTALRDFRTESLTEAALRGGSITAWGRTDIDDPVSELHNRYEIGVHSYGRHHSIDTGKYTMAPLFADVCANRIVPARRSD
jgi:glycine/D-amino acid oxidase-like deaminating enzyme